MNTKAEVMARLEGIADDEIIAVPTIWTKSIAEETWELVDGDAVKFTPVEWQEIVNEFYAADVFDEEAMVDAIRGVLERR